MLTDQEKAMEGSIADFTPHQREYIADNVTELTYLSTVHGCQLWSNQWAREPFPAKIWKAGMIYEYYYRSTVNHWP